MKVLIIDAAEAEASELEHLIRQVNPAVEIQDRLSSVQEAVRYLINRPQPELIFLDVQLDDGIAFEIFQEVKIQVPLVFTSHNTAWAVKALKLNTLGYLVKPIDRNSVISIFYKFKTTAQYYAGLNPGNDRETRKTASADVSLEAGQRIARKRFIASTGDKIRYVPAGDIAWFKADGNLVYLITHAGDRLILDETLEEVYDALDHQIFFRLNRTYICQVDALKDIRKYFNSRLKIGLHPDPGTGEEVLVSRNRVHEFMTWLGS